MVKTPRNVPEPAKLISNRRKWTVRYQRILATAARGDWATNDAKKVLSAALYRLAHGKCVFCESPLDVGSGALHREDGEPRSRFRMGEPAAVLSPVQSIQGQCGSRKCLT